MNYVVDGGYLEAGHRLVNIAGRSWNQQELLSAAERAVLRNTGWPIGLVLTTPDLAPSPTPEGVEARITKRVTGTGEDFWFFRSDGSYYVSRTFEEDEAIPGSEPPDRRRPIIWFEVRIWRIAEVVLHSATIYRELGVPPDEPYILTINHEGLNGRTLTASEPRRYVHQGAWCRSARATWSREVTEDFVSANVQPIVSEVANGVFALFDFAKIGDGEMKEIVDGFLHRRF